jgi:hypothetical protein
MDADIIIEDDIDVDIGIQQIEGTDSILNKEDIHNKFDQDNSEFIINRVAE